MIIKGLSNFEIMSQDWAQEKRSNSKEIEKWPEKSKPLERFPSSSMFQKERTPVLYCWQVDEDEQQRPDHWIRQPEITGVFLFVLYIFTWEKEEERTHPIPVQCALRLVGLGCARARNWQLDTGLPCRSAAAWALPCRPHHLHSPQAGLSSQS